MMTIGSALQGNKYVIEAILNQCELGITYRANHTYLNQPVILQTLNQVAQQRQDFPQLKQQFMQGVQAAIKQPSSVQVLDGFEEDGLPFVVLQCPSEQVPILSDWLSLPSTSPQSINTSPQPDVTKGQAVSSEKNDHAQAASVTREDQIEATSPPQVPVTAPVTQADRPSALRPPVALNNSRSNGAATNGHGITANSTNVSSANAIPNSTAANPISEAKMPVPAKPARSSYISAPSPKPKPRFPAALVIVALLGSCTGAGMGAALRLSSAPSPEGTNKPRLTLFDREQSFPSEGGWPVQARPVYTPEPAIEQPLYRTTPPEYIPDASLQPIPSETVPFSPSPLPEVDPYLSEPDTSTLEDELPPVKSQPKPPIEPEPLDEAPLLEDTAPPIDTLPPLAPDSPVSPMPPLIPTPLAPAPDDAVIPPTSKKPGNSFSRVVSQ